MQPFVKWAGGKRQLLSKIIEESPKEFNKYFEPFIGGGAVFFAIEHQEATINDINTQLIHTYNIIKNEPHDFIKLLDEYDSILLNQDKYNEIRSLFNSKITDDIYDLELAVLFVFLNKHAFNGLYRVNSKGLFNVPWNKKDSGSSFSKDNILSISDYLQSVTILNGDFEVAVKDAKDKDFVFLDSPYAPINPSSFDSYDKAGFGLEEHVRLSKLFKELTERGCYCMLTNHNTELIRDLYKEYNIEEVNVRRSINSDSSKRVGKEVIIKNY